MQVRKLPEAREKTTSKYYKKEYLRLTQSGKECLSPSASLENLITLGALVRVHRRDLPPYWGIITLRLIENCSSTALKNIKGTPERIKQFPSNCVTERR